MRDKLHKCCEPSCPGLPYKASELAHPCKPATPDIQERAREIAPGLTTAQQDGVAFFASPHGSSSAEDQAAWPRTVTCRKLQELGLVDMPGSRWSATITDLGRAVAAVLAGGGT